ncbi:MAG: 3-keto-5-aminohexanoate cleavage protein [Pseudonocardiaceae bacterium]
MSGTLITVAPTGAEHVKSEVAGLPVTLPELVATARECEQLGAAMVHVHVRDGTGRPTLDPVWLREAVAALRAETRLVVQLSTGGAVTDPEPDRLAVLDVLPDSASCTMGSVNFGDDVFLNRWPFIVALHRGMQERRIVPEYEIFDLGQLTSLRRLLDEHGAPWGDRVHVDFVMGMSGGMPGNIATLVAAVAGLPAAASFSATGIGRAHLPVALAALSAGGHLRVGMEDTLSYARGRRVIGNAELVARAAELARIAQRPPLSPDEGRAMLGASRSELRPIVS